MKVPFLDLGWQEQQIREDRERRFADIIEHTAFVLGPHVAAFEKEFAAYCGAQFAVGVSGGTPALTMIFNALGLTSEDEVITIPTTFFATVSAIVHAGAKPVLVDIDPQTRNFNFEHVERAITSRTKVIVPVHLYGVPVDMDQVMQIAQKHNLIVVEDCSQAHGATFKGQNVGTFGFAAAFSFYPGKNLGAYGDGGAVVTNDQTCAERVKALRNQGCFMKYDHELLGYNGRLDALQAAVLSAKLPHLEAWNALRRSIAVRYQEGLKDLPLVLPSVPDAAVAVWHLFVVEPKQGSRDEFIQYVNEAGIATGIHYPLALHTTPALQFLPYQMGDFTVSEALAERCVTLPLYPGMSDEQVAYVITTIRAYFHEK